MFNPILPIKHIPLASPTCIASVSRSVHHVEPATKTEFKAPVMRIRGSNSHASRRQSLKPPASVMQEHVGESIASGKFIQLQHPEPTKFVASATHILRPDTPLYQSKRASTEPLPTLGLVEQQPKLHVYTSCLLPEPCSDPFLLNATPCRPTKRRLSVPSLDHKTERRSMRDVMTRRSIKTFASFDSDLWRATTRQLTERPLIPELLMGLPDLVQQHVEGKGEDDDLRGKSKVKEPSSKHQTTYQPNEEVRRSTQISGRPTLWRQAIYQPAMIIRKPLKIQTQRFEESGVRISQAPVSASNTSQEADETNNHVVRPDSTHLSVLDEPLAAYDVYHASPEVVSDSLPEEVAREELPVAHPLLPPPAPLTRESTTQAPSHHLDLLRAMGRYSPMTGNSAELVLARKPTLLVQNMGVDSEITGAPVSRRVSRSITPVPPRLDRRKTCVSPSANHRTQQAFTVPSNHTERQREASIAAPGIVNAPPQLRQTCLKSTAVQMKSRKKTVNYPPERQYPPAPPYPVRDTPTWTRPDTHAPPPKPKAAATKRVYYGFSAMLKKCSVCSMTKTRTRIS